MLYSMIEVSDGRQTNFSSASSVDKMNDNLVLGTIAHSGWKAHEDFLRLFSRELLESSHFIAEFF